MKAYELHWENPRYEAVSLVRGWHFRVFSTVEFIKRSFSTLLLVRGTTPPLRTFSEQLTLKLLKNLVIIIELLFSGV